MAKNQYQLVTFFLNGKEVEKMVDVRASLTDMLRSDFSMTSVKKGCDTAFRHIPGIRCFPHSFRYV